MNLESGVLQVHIEDIIPNRFQPRLTFDEQGLKELSDSIREHGIIQPLVLRKLGDKFEIIAGERRYKAAQMAGLTTVPAVIANIDDNKSAEVALVENVQRRDLTAIEEARSYKNLLDKGYLTQEQLAKRMGLSQPAIANKLRLLNLDEEVQQALLEEKISERHARTLLTLQDKNAQREWLHKIINERLTVRQLDMELKKMKSANNFDEDDGNGEIPLVSAIPSIEDIKANAMDISMANKMATTAPTETLETLETLDEGNTFNKETQSSPFATFDPSVHSNESFTTATKIPEFNIATPNSASTFVPKENLTDTSNDSNKFFSFGNEQLEPAASPMPTFQAADNNNSSTSFEIFDAPTVNNSFINEQITPVAPPESQTPPMNSGISTFDSSSLNNSFDMNPNNRFFTPVSEANREVTINKPEEKAIDPMDAVDQLTSPQGFNSSSSETGLKDAISTIRTTIEGLGAKGFVIDVEEIDFTNNYQITMRIHKDN